MTEAAPACPGCGSRLSPILYGHPSADMMREGPRAGIVFGGCVLDSGSASWSCRACETTYLDDLSPAPARD